MSGHICTTIYFFVNNISVEYGVTTLLGQITMKGARTGSGSGPIYKSKSIRRSFSRTT